MNEEIKNKIDQLDFSKGDGLLPVVVQEYQTNEVLMLAYVNKEALINTLEGSTAWYYSRSRDELWNKGATSGHYQHMKAIKVDCDNDTLLYIVEQDGAACHTGNHTCFYRDL